MKILIVATAAFMLAGCISSAPPTPKNWTISSTTKVKNGIANAELKPVRVTRLGDVSVAAPYDKTALAVMRQDGSIAFDAYNAFASSPAALLRAPIADLLGDCGRYGRVLWRTNAARCDSTAEIYVTDLYLDCRKEGKRVARVSISISIVENREILEMRSGDGEADATNGDYSAAFSEALEQAVVSALKK